MADHDYTRARSIVAAAISELSMSGQTASRVVLEAELGGLGSLAIDIGALEEARTAWEHVVDSRASVFPEGSIELLGPRVQLAKCLVLLEDYTRAREIAHDAVERLDGVVLDEHSTLLDAREVLGMCSLRQGDPPTANAQMSRVVATLERTQPRSLRLGQARHNWSAALVALGDLRGALAIQEALVVEFEATLPADHPSLQASRQAIAIIRSELGDKRASLELEEAAFAQLSRTLPEGHPQLRDARANLAVTLADLGQYDRARELQEAVVAELEVASAPDDPELLSARLNLATTLHTVGDLELAEKIESEVLAIREAVLPPDHAALRAARTNLGLTLLEVDRSERALELFRAVRESTERTLPADHPLVAAARTNEALAYINLQRFEEALPLLQAALQGLPSSLPEDHPQILLAQLNLVRALGGLGEVQAASDLAHSVLATFERLLPEADPNLQKVRLSCAEAFWHAGDAHAAVALEERAIAAYEAAFTAGHPRLDGARGSLALSLRDRGELRRARAMLESLFATYSARFSADHPRMLSTREALAAVLIDLGDVRAGMRLLEEVNDAQARSLPADHPNRLRTLSNLAATRQLTGDLLGARVLFSAVLEGRTRTLREDHPDVNDARNNLAANLLESDDAAQALPLLREVLESTLRSKPHHGLDVAGARANLGVCLAAVGEHRAGAELLREALQFLEAVLPLSPGRFFNWRMGYAVALSELGDRDGLEEALQDLLSSAMRALRSVELSSRRETRERLAALSRPIGTLLSLEGEVPSSPALLPGIFTLIESERAFVSTCAFLPAQRSNPELAALAARVRAASTRLAATVAAGSEQQSDDARSSVADAIRARDAAERELQQALSVHGIAPLEIDVQSVARGLPPDGCAVGVRRYLRQRSDEDVPGSNRASEGLVALIVDAGGTVSRVDLGSAQRIDAAVQAWREAIGVSTGIGGRGLGRRVVDGAGDRRVTAASDELDRLVVGPILSRCGAARQIHLALDGALLLVPFDALTHGGRLVGETHAIHHETSFGRLLRPSPRLVDARNLLAVGGIDFSARTAAERSPLDAKSAEAATLEEAIASRGVPSGGWPPLPGSESEARRAAELFEASFGVKPVLLLGCSADKEAVVSAAPGKRYLHLATHGFFATGGLPSGSGSDATDPSPARTAMSILVREMAPFSLCGLALAGADGGLDVRGENRGILTAEEIAGLDLTACELAVLSACESGIGISRAGQGLQSLQAALHAAGVRSAICSSWVVSDEATRELFTNFYSRIWTRGESKATALWNAKLDLRSAGRSPREWAGWVLTGDSSP